MDDYRNMISFIVSVYDRTDMLPGCLETLAVQETVKEVLVCHNGKGAAGPVFDSGLRLWNHWHSTGLHGAKSSYESADMVAPTAKGDWVCFPSDDSLYVRGFSRIMLETAEKTGAGLIYCDCVYHRPDEPSWKPYTVLDVSPRMGRIDKTCFILRRELFKGFPPHPKGWSDGALIEQLVAQGVRHAKAPGILVVHQ